MQISYKDIMYTVNLYTDKAQPRVHDSSNFRIANEALTFEV